MYHKNYPHAITSRMRDYLAILRDKGVKREKHQEFHFRPKIDLSFYFYAACVLLPYFDIFVNFDNLFTPFLSIIRPLKVGMTTLGEKL